MPEAGMLAVSAPRADRRVAFGPRRSSAERDGLRERRPEVHHRHSWHWRSRHFDPVYAAGCGARWSREWADEAARHAQRWAHRRFDEEELVGRAGLGVRRPLRFLVWKLDLDDEQAGKLARILERLKLERAQAALDLRRGAADLADALEASEIAQAALGAAGELRVAAARRIEAAVAAAIAELHALLEPDQRARLAELIRTGAIRI
jgi:hypothetical protein